MSKKITTILFIAAFMLLSSLAFAAEDNNIINVYVNNKSVQWTDAKPFIDSNSRTMIPLRAVAENLGAEVSWDSNTSTAKVVLGSKNVELQVGKNFGLVNGSKIEMDTRTIVSGDRTYVPLRFVSEALGYEIKYKFGRDERANNKTAHIIDINSAAKVDTKDDFRAGNYEELFFSNGYHFERSRFEIVANVHFISDGYIEFSSRPSSTRAPGAAIFTVQRGNGAIVISQIRAFRINDTLTEKFLNDILDYLFQDESKVLKDEIIGSFKKNQINSIYSLAKVLETSKTVGRFNVSYTEKPFSGFENDYIKIVIKY